jgi:hypothetical protein
MPKNSVRGVLLPPLDDVGAPLYRALPPLPADVPNSVSCWRVVVP